MSKPVGPTGRVHVHASRVQTLASEWRRQEWDLRSARDALAALPPSALAPSGLREFLVAWSAEIGDLAKAVGSVADGLASAGSDFMDVDHTVANR